MVAFPLSRKQRANGAAPFIPQLESESASENAEEDKVNMDTLGIEPRASRMLSGCDTTTPCALYFLCFYRWPAGIFRVGLGLVAFADFMPNLVLAPLAGAVADRFDRLKAMRLYMAISAIISSAIAGLTITGMISVEILALLVLANGIAMSFNFCGVNLGCDNPDIKDMVG